MGKSFKAVPTPLRKPEAANESVLDFVSGGRSAAPAPASSPAGKGPVARLSLDLPAELHARYKAACARSRVKMTPDLIALIEQRTAKLEGQSS